MSITTNICSVFKMSNRRFMTWQNYVDTISMTSIQSECIDDIIFLLLQCWSSVQYVIECFSYNMDIVNLPFPPNISRLYVRRVLSLCIFKTSYLNVTSDFLFQTRHSHWKSKFFQTEQTSLWSFFRRFQVTFFYSLHVFDRSLGWDLQFFSPPPRPDITIMMSA